MGRCVYCGEPAGWFSQAHAECERAHRDFETQVFQLIRYASDTRNIAGLYAALNAVRGRSPLNRAQQQQIIVGGWQHAAEEKLNDGYLDEQEEVDLVALAHECQLTQEEIDGTEVSLQVAKASVLRRVMHGDVPAQALGALPITLNLQRGERIVWAFDDASFLEDRTYRHHVGRSDGLSVRIATGVYYRRSVYRGEPVDVEKRVHVDDGTVVITDRHVYFVGSRKSFRVPYAKVVSFQSYADGFGLMKDGASAKQQTFVVGDGWFAYNLVTNLSAMSL